MRFRKTVDITEHVRTDTDPGLKPGQWVTITHPSHTARGRFISYKDGYWNIFWPHPGRPAHCLAVKIRVAIKNRRYHRTAKGVN